MKKMRWLSFALALCCVAASCGRSDDGTADAPPVEAPDGATSTTEAIDECDAASLQATDVGVTAESITVTVMADTGSPLAPGLFQGNVDAMNAFAEHVNASGGLACRELVVEAWDSKLSADESKNGIISACGTSLAMVGSNALFNPDPSAYATCTDMAGLPTGLPDIAALAADVHQQCNSTTYLIQAVFETCPITPDQPRPISTMVGPARYFVDQLPGLHGIYLVAGDLPSGAQLASSTVRSFEEVGVTWDATPRVSGRDEQPAYTPRVALIREHQSNFVYNGSNDVAMIKMRGEARAQGSDTVTLWACSLACYTKNMISAGGIDAEGVYVWMQFLPFEEADSNPELQAYLDAIGSESADSWGAQAWQAGVAFTEAIDRIVDEGGPNAITRNALLAELESFGTFDSNGWIGEKSLRGVSSCFLIMQVKDGAFTRVHPAERGTMDCDPANLLTIAIDPVVEAEKIR